MQVSLLGADGNQLCQLGAIRDGFAVLGHQHTPRLKDADTEFVFVGNPPFEPYLELARTKEKKTIFNILDCPTHCYEWPEYRKLWAEQLRLPDKVTSISKTTQSELKRHCGIDSEVIYYPMKPVKYLGGTLKHEKIKVLLVGRLNDPNKRVPSAISALIRAGFEEYEVGIVGPENPHYGTYFGIVSDEMLNILYNSVEYVVMLSHVEGIGLPAIEGACCGAIPIVAPDLLTFNEFWAESPLGKNYQKLTSIDEISKLLISLNNDDKWRAAVKQDVLGYAELAFRPKFDRVEVAKRILEVYQGI